MTFGSGTILHKFVFLYFSFVADLQTLH